jgi:hypothetical protein
MEKMFFKETYETPLVAGTEHRVWWLFSKNMRTVKAGTHYLVSWLVDRETGDVVTGKYETTLAPHIWFGYASKKMASIAREQKSTCTCSTNTLEYSEQHLHRIGATPAETLALELPFDSCASGKLVPTATVPPTLSNAVTTEQPPLRGGCFAANLKVGRPLTSFEWSGLFRFDQSGEYEWIFRSNGAPRGQFSYPDLAIGIYVAEAATLASVQSTAQRVLANASSSAVVRPDGRISLVESRRQSLEFQTDSLYTRYKISVDKPNSTYAIFTEHMPWEFTATHMVGPIIDPTASTAAPSLVFPLDADEFALDPGAVVRDEAGVELPLCIKANRKSCRKAAGRCRWLKEEEQCTTCSGCSCNAQKSRCKAASDDECTWWENEVRCAV